VPARYLLRTDDVRDHLDRKHWSHHRVARHLGISKAYWSQLLNRRRALTPDMRTLLLSSPLFQGVPEVQLWDRLEPSDATPAS
jgi:plasmid maintenance system antidote protein VapI